MHKERIAKFVSNQNITIVDAMEKIDNNAKGILFIEDEAGCLVGCITDGDIRRWLIKTGDLQATVKIIVTQASNQKHRYLRENSCLYFSQQQNPLNYAL